MRFRVVLVLVLLAGCTGAEPPAAPGEAVSPAAASPSAPAPEGPAPEGAAPAASAPVEADAPCAAPRASVAHDAAGARGPAPARLCVFRTAHGGGENTMGICPSTGAVFAGLAQGEGGLGLVASEDGGASWRFLLPSLQGHATHKITLDPYVYVDPATCRVFLDDLTTPNCSVLSWTDDAGATWGHSVAGCGEFDHQTIFAGPPVTSPTLGYPNIVYRCAINAVATGGGSVTATCQRSLDGGLTWLPPGAPAFVPTADERGHYNLTLNCDGATGHGVADAEGRIYLPKGCGRPWILLSDDEGITWTQVRVSTIPMKIDNGGIADHDGSVAIDAAGRLYYAWIGEDRLPHLAVSTDRGATWKDVGALAPPGLVDSALASIDVTPDGVVGLAYYGSYDAAAREPLPPCEEALADCAQRLVTAHEVGNEGSWHGHVALVRGAAEGAPVVWTATTGDDPLVRGACGVRCQDALDFQDVVMAPDGSAWATFVDAAADGELLVARLG